MSPLSKFLNLGSKPKAGQLYGAAVAQARRPAFYASIGVDDTPDGRLAMISLHILLILERLSGSIRSKDEMSPGSGLASGPEAGLKVGVTSGSSSSAQQAKRDPALGQALMEVFVEDLDQAMRELGIGDMGVPKRVKKAMAQFYEYARRYRALVQGDTSETLDVLLCEMIPGLHGGARLKSLGKYVRDVEASLAAQTCQSLAAGKVDYPDLDVTQINGTPASAPGKIS